MEPLKPEKKEALLRNSPQAAPEDIAEYERLLASRFTMDPSLLRSPDTSQSVRAREQRLRELYIKLFNK
jgi:hypothetical protein